LSKGDADVQKKSTGIPAILCIVISIVALVIWFCVVIFAFLLGGSPGPGYERSFPGLYIGIVALGFLGAALALAVGIRGLKRKAVGKLLPIFVIVLGIIGSVPFFAMDLAEMGLITLMVGIPPSLLSIIVSRKQGSEKEL